MLDIYSSKLLSYQVRAGRLLPQQERQNCAYLHPVLRVSLAG